MQLTTNIAGKTALITGASSGMGQATAKRMAEAGVQVFALGRSADGLAQTKADVEAIGGDCTTLQLDISEPGVITEAIDQVVKDAGKINVLVNNAAVMYMDNTVDTSVASTAKLMQINLLSAIEGAQTAIKHMRAGGEEGHIVSVSSLASRLPGGGIYGASKAALERVMEQLRTEVEFDDIRITTIVPGGFATNLGRDTTPERREAFQKNIAPLLAGAEPDADGRTPIFGVPDDIARAIVFAVAQPIYLNIYEMVVRPARNINPGSLRD